MAAAGGGNRPISLRVAWKEVALAKPVELLTWVLERVRRSNLRVVHSDCTSPMQMFNEGNKTLRTFEYRSQHFLLHSGDVLVAHTDGVRELRMALEEQVFRGH